jgi:hypothetical protein
MEPSINHVVQRLQMAKVGYVNASPVREGRVTARIDDKRAGDIAGEAVIGPETATSND